MPIADALQEEGEINVGAVVLVAAKARGYTFADAWATAMRELRPGRGCEPALAARLEIERALLRELKPALRELYDGTPPTEQERQRCRSLADRRLDALDLPPETEPYWQAITAVIGGPPS